MSQVRAASQEVADKFLTWEAHTVRVGATRSSSVQQYKAHVLEVSTLIDLLPATMAAPHRRALHTWGPCGAP